MPEYIFALEQSNHQFLVAKSFSLHVKVSFVLFVVGQSACDGSWCFSGLLERANGKVFKTLHLDSCYHPGLSVQMNRGPGTVEQLIK